MVVARRDAMVQPNSDLLPIDVNALFDVIGPRRITLTIVAPDYASSVVRQCRRKHLAFTKTVTCDGDVHENEVLQIVS